MEIDQDKVRREQIRWVILRAVYNAQPSELVEAVILGTIQSILPDATPLEVRRALDYLSDRGLVKIRKDPAGPWWSDLTRYGTDIVEYTIDCAPGIARPQKYW